MKTSIKLFALGMILMGFGVNANAQSTIQASTTALLVTPISITKNVDMNFGTVASSGTDGTVTLDYANGRIASGGASLPAGSTAQKTAVFTVTGEGNSAFTIAIPTAPITLTGSIAGTMTVGTFVADLGAASTLSSGSKVIKVQAILTVPANTVAGTYTNASDLFVTVNYN